MRPLICICSRSLKSKHLRKSISTPVKKRGRPPKRTDETESKCFDVISGFSRWSYLCFLVLPMLDDDDVDGVYATSSLNGAVTYTHEDAIDPEEVEDGEDVHVDGGPHACKFCKFATTSAEVAFKCCPRNTLMLGVRRLGAGKTSRSTPQPKHWLHVSAM